MKGRIIAIVLILCCIAALCGCEKVNDEYLRIHIRANSNLQEDQAIKLVVRDEVVKYLTPLLADKKSLSDAKRTVIGHKEELEKVADIVLRQYGFFYGAKCSVKVENFPERTYGDLTLKSGRYQAIIIELGEGTGDNWWCVAFPPLCFVGDGQGEIEYKSILYEWLKRR